MQRTCVRGSAGRTSFVGRYLELPCQRNEKCRRQLQHCETNATSKKCLIRRLNAMQPSALRTAISIAYTLLSAAVRLMKSMQCTFVSCTVKRHCLRNEKKNFNTNVNFRFLSPKHRPLLGHLLSSVLCFCSSCYDLFNKRRKVFTSCQKIGFINIGFVRSFKERHQILISSLLPHVAKSASNPP